MFALAQDTVTLISTITLVLALLLVIVGEVARIRSSVYYILGGGAVLAAWPLLSRFGSIGQDPTKLADLWSVFATAGFAGGFIYWLVAGRRANGLPRSATPSAWREQGRRPCRRSGDTTWSPVLRPLQFRNLLFVKNARGPGSPPARRDLVPAARAGEAVRVGGEAEMTVHPPKPDRPDGRAGRQAANPRRPPRSAAASCACSGSMG